MPLLIKVYVSTVGKIQSYANYRFPSQGQKTNQKQNEIIKQISKQKISKQLYLTKQ